MQNFNEIAGNTPFFDEATGRLIGDIAPNADVTKEPTGFPNRVDSTFSFNDGTRTFTIQPVGVSFDYWQQSVKHTVSTTKTIVLPNTTAKYFIYFDGTETLGQTIVFDDSVLNDKVLVAVVYYNATTGKGEFILDERHGLTMDWATHFHLHNSFGTRYYGGFGLSYIIGDGSLDSHAQIALGSGTIADEDIPTTIVDSATPSAFFEQVLSPIALIPNVYILGSHEWQKDTATNYPFKLATGVPQYNLNTLGTWTLEDVTDGNYFAAWIFVINEINTPIISIVGTRQDTSLADAKNNNTYGSIDWGDLPSQEYKVLYRLIYKYDTSYSNTTKVALIEVEDIRGAVDAVLNSSTLSPVSDHGSLVGLNDDDHPQYHNDTRGDLRYYTQTQSNLNYEPKNSNIQSHISNTSNPHNVTKTQVGLGSVDNVQQYPNSNPSGFETPTQLNTRDTNNRDRTNHTGTQIASTISDFASTVRGVTLTGLAAFTNVAITAADTILSAFARLQGQINAKANISGQTFTGSISATNLSNTNTGDETTLSIQTKRPLKTVNGNSLEGAGNVVVNVSGLTVTNPSNATLIQSASGTGGVANGTNYVDGTNISISFPALPVGATIVSSEVLITYTSNNPSYLSELLVRMTPPNSAQQSDLEPLIANVSGTVNDIVLANFTTEDPVGSWLFEFRDTFNDTGVDVNITDITINTTYTLDTNLFDFDGIIQAKKFIGDGSQLTNLPQHVQLVKAYLTQTQAITTTTPNTLTNHVFIIPPQKTLSLQGVLIFTSGANNTGAYYGVLVTQPTGADGNAIGSFSIGVTVSSSAANSELRDGDAINVAGAGSLESGVLGTASTGGNNSGNMILNVTNTSTNVSTVVEIRFRSETGTAVTAQIGTMATGLIG